MSELPNPVNVDAACETVRIEDLADSVPSGPDAEPYVRVLRSYLDAGFENSSIVPVGDDLAGTIRFWQDEVQPVLANANA